MNISECKIGDQVIKNEILTGSGEKGVVVGFVSNILNEKIPVVKWGETCIKRSIHPANILKDDHNG
jgi:hypothetical protein